jgi:hypothetical protein
MILKYNDLELRFRNLLYEHIESMNAPADEKKRIREEWENFIYLNNNRR